MVRNPGRILATDLPESLHALFSSRRPGRDGRPGLTLSWVANRIGCDHAAVWRLEYGKQPNPRVNTVMRHVEAIALRIDWGLVERDDAPIPGGKTASGYVPPMPPINHSRLDPALGVREEDSEFPRGFAPPHSANQPPGQFGGLAACSSRTAVVSQRYSSKSGPIAKRRSWALPSGSISAPESSTSRPRTRGPGRPIPLGRIACMSREAPTRMSRAGPVQLMTRPTVRLSGESAHRGVIVLPGCPQFLGPADSVLALIGGSSNADFRGGENRLTLRKKLGQRRKRLETQKPCTGTLRVNESRPAELGQQPEASLAWGEATLTAKCRQRVPRPCD